MYKEVVERIAHPPRLSFSLPTFNFPVNSLISPWWVGLDEKQMTFLFAVGVPASSKTQS